MTKEEILAGVIKRSNETLFSNAQKVALIAMDEWAKQEAIEFQRWLSLNYDYNEFESSWGTFNEDDGKQSFDKVATEQLYNLYLQSKQKVKP